MLWRRPIRGPCHRRDPCQSERAKLWCKLLSAPRVAISGRADRTHSALAERMATATAVSIGWQWPHSNVEAASGSATCTRQRRAAGGALGVKAALLLT